MRNAPWITEFQVDDGDSMFFIFLTKSFLFFKFFLKIINGLQYSMFLIWNLTRTLETCAFFSRNFYLVYQVICAKKTSTNISITTDIQSIAIH